jgi:hypothetical protein
MTPLLGIFHQSPSPELTLMHAFTSLLATNRTLKPLDFLQVVLKNTIDLLAFHGGEFADTYIRTSFVTKSMKSHNDKKKAGNLRRKSHNGQKASNITTTIS